MMRCALSIVLMTSLFVGGTMPHPAKADNPMGYRLLSTDEAVTLPARHGALGLDVERSREITDNAMTFDLIRVKQVRRGSAGAQAGLQAGDQIISVNGRVFPSLAAFKAYVGAMAPGTPATVDYIPNGGGPAQAQRVSVMVGGAGTGAPNSPNPNTNPNTDPNATGLSTGAKIAIGVGAAALLGCYEAGCFSHRDAPRAQGQGARPLQSAPQPR